MTMNNPIHAGLVEVDLEYLRAVLKFPADAVIERAFFDEYRHPRSLMLVVRHPGLPAHYEGNVLTKVSAWFNADGFMEWRI
jgi:hypothetical protein